MFTSPGIHKSFSDLLLSKVSDYLNPGDIEKSYVEAGLSIDGMGYSIGPHGDTGMKLMSAMIYIPLEHREEYRKVCSTVIYEPRDKRMKLTDEHYSFEKFDVLRVSGGSGDRE